MSRGVALVLIDVQNDFLGEPALSPSREQLLTAIGGLVAAARSAGVTVAHVRTEFSADGSDVPTSWADRPRVPCVSGTTGAMAPGTLEATAGEPVVIKRGYDAFLRTELEAVLRSLGVRTVVLAGLHTHACVRQAAMGAHALGFEVVIAGDAVASYDADHAARSLTWMEGRVSRRLDARAVSALFAESRDASGRRMKHADPTDAANGLFSFEAAEPEAVENAARRASQAHRGGLKETADARARLLHAWHGRLTLSEEEWRSDLMRDVAKPMAEARGETEHGLAFLAATVRRLTEGGKAGTAGVAVRPTGVVGLITPWNNPFAIPVTKLAASLAAGNHVVWKPAPAGTRIAERIMESLGDELRARVTLLRGGAATARAVAASACVDAVTFTGSAAAGRGLAALCGSLLKPFQAELGGNNAAIVLADADLGAAARDLAGSMFSFAGQRCTAVRRVIVESSVSEEFRSLLTEAVGALRLGPPSDPATQVGPVIDLSARDRLGRLVEAAKARGALPLLESAPPEGLPPRGAWFAPCLLADMSDDCPSWRDESFGPVGVVRTAADLGEAIRLHDGVEQGLLGVLYARSRDSWTHFRTEARAGMLSLNRARPAFSPELPFSGWKASGLGPPEHGRWDLEFHGRTQAVYGEDADA